MKTITYAAAIALAVGLAPVMGLGTAAAQEAQSGPGYGTYDQNQDAMLTEDEYGAFEQDFAEFDEDESGDINQDEFRAWGEDTWGEDYNEEETAGLFGEWDENQDAALTEDEWGGGDEFADLDENESGTLEEDEGWF